MGLSLAPQTREPVVERASPTPRAFPGMMGIGGTKSWVRGWCCHEDRAKPVEGTSIVSPGTLVFVLGGLYQFLRYFYSTFTRHFLWPVLFQFCAPVCWLGFANRCFPHISRGSSQGSRHRELFFLFFSAGAQNERKDFPPGKANEDTTPFRRIAILAMSGYA
jgi:hypothetical protein